MTEQKVKVFKLSREGASSLSETNPIRRQDLITSSNSWVGIAHTMAGLPSAWHHHTDNETYGYVVSGRVRIEFAPGGRESVEIGPGEVFHVPGRVIHREVTVGAEAGMIFLVRVGTCKPVIDVDGPEES